MGMKGNVRRLLAAAIIAFIIAGAVDAQNYGRITGRIVDGDDGGGMPGANITVVGTSLGTASDGRGNYLISRVPAGDHTIRVTYLGFGTQERSIKVTAGGISTANFEMKVTLIQMDEVVVLGTRAKGQASALNQQHNAVNIQNVVAADQMGRFPDASAPESLQRVPGVHIVRDQGEGRYVQVRGASPAMTSVTFNGERIPSPEGDVRQIALDAVPTEILESIEVSKTITPDMDADAIGGSVNLVTRQAPEDGIFTIEGTAGYGQLREDGSGKGSITWGQRASDGKTGFLVSGTWSKRNFGSDDLEPEWEFNDVGLADDELKELQVRHYTLSRDRRALTGVIDYRLAPQSSLQLTGTYTEMVDHEFRRRLIHVVEDDELSYRHKDREESLKSMNFSGKGRHTLGSGAEFSYHATISRSEEDTPFDREIEFLQEDVAFAPDISNPAQPQPNPQGGALSSGFLFDKIEPGESITRNTDYVAAANYAHPFGGGGEATGKFKFGLKYRHKDKIQDITEREYGLADGAPDIILGQGIGAPFDLAGYNPGRYQFPNAVPTVDEVVNFVSARSGLLEAENNISADAEDFDATEKTFAAYGLAEVNVSPRVMLLGGVRVEYTQLDNTGNFWDDNNETLTATSGSGSYTKFFPMGHLRYRASEVTNIRLAVTTALLRPNFFDLAPYRIEEDDEAEIGNPELDPAYSVNLDLLLEHYFEPVGVVAAGVFYKRIQDPIFKFTNDGIVAGEAGEIAQPRNGDNAWVAGLELTLQQQKISFLPQPFDGLGFYGNYTLTSSETKLADGRKADLAGQAKHVANLAVSYERGSFSGQVSMNFHDKFLDEFGGDIGGSTFDDVYVREHLQFDLSATVQINRQVSVFVEWLNMTNEPWELYQADESRPIQREYYESWGQIGLKFRL